MKGFSISALLVALLVSPLLLGTAKPGVNGSCAPWGTS
jgi:hypothetical protein